MVDNLSCLRSAGRKAEAEYDVVKSSFEKDKHVLTGDTSHGFSLVEVSLELFLAKSVYSLCLLFLPELNRIA